MKKILIVDDDASFIEALKASLDPKKFITVSAADGEEGLKRMEESKPDLILLDIKMPKLGGMEFLKRVNEKYGEGKTAVLITSNLSGLEQISEGMELGIRGYFVKSNESLKGITDMIDRVLE